jgi:hypothetical protein
MSNIPGLEQHLYGSASKEFLATKCKIGDFLQPIYWKEKKRIKRELEEMMMIRNLSVRPPKPISKIAGTDIGFGIFNKKKEESFRQDDDV